MLVLTSSYVAFMVMVHDHADVGLTPVPGGTSMSLNKAHRSIRSWT